MLDDIFDLFTSDRSPAKPRHVHPPDHRNVDDHRPRRDSRRREQSDWFDEI